ncbi:gamma-glutamyltransferase [Sediminicoccus rosea]|uniref:Gamma-glutamyltransferase n=1 Tax=Sediminicoccus rosea TaxID=1225128 RepID=A0ABZ0PMW5_9PROT|nr:gamma-glutamyltransferase [Sediminicoccus rosea]WPB87078.1 gamma-glutamyltransferase [Sediminicoccus rosea]
MSLPPHVSQHWIVRKPAARGEGGMVASQSRDAAEAGAEILRAGGTAADAAVGAAFALATVEPWNSGLGGIGFTQVMKPGGPAETFDFGPVAPRGLDPSAYPLTGRLKNDLFAWPEVVGDVNIHGPKSALIPSAVAGYAELHKRHGRMPIKDVMAPAVALARRGLSQDWFTTLKVANSAAVLRMYEESARIYLPGGLPPVPPYQGTPGFFQQGRLADTLERLQHAGLQDFYTGDVAASIAADMKAMGGFVTAEDLAACAAVVRPALERKFRGRTWMLANGLTAAPTLSRLMELMEGAPYAAIPDAGWYAHLARSLRAAYAERLAGLGDAEPKGADSCTTHLTVADKDGMMIAMTTTLLSSMGSRMVLPGSGVLMNNGVMWFDPTPGSANAIAPGKRPLCNMCPVIALDAKGMPEFAGGASGGRRIMAAVFQVFSYALDFAMEAEAASHHPRLDVSGPEGVTADRRLGEAVIAALAADSPVEVVEHAVMPVNFACPNMIQQKAGMRVGVTDTMSPWSAAVAE